MSWEEGRTTLHDCPCGKGKYSSTRYSDDWGRSDERVTMICPECNGKYVVEHFQRHDGDDAWRWKLKA